MIIVKEELFMTKLQLIILTQEDLKKRYDKLKNTNMARFTNEAILSGFSIGILWYAGLSKDDARDWLRNAENAVAMNFEGQSYKIGAFTDLSEVDKDKFYFSFKTKKGVQIAHSLSGCDSEGFIYNC